MLTPAEKAAARAFRDSQQALLDKLNADPDFAVDSHPMLLAHHLRHDCGGKSISFEMKEVYTPSRPYFWHACGAVEEWRADPSSGEPEPSPLWSHDCGLRKPVIQVPAARFAFIWRYGRCSSCSRQGRTRTGRLVDARQRPPAGRS